MDQWAWFAARAAQAVSRHLNAVESQAATYSARMRRDRLAQLADGVGARDAAAVAPAPATARERTAAEPAVATESRDAA